jgi:hypothetical protein
MEALARTSISPPSTHLRADQNGGDGVKFLVAEGRKNPGQSRECEERRGLRVMIAT